MTRRTAFTLVELLVTSMLFVIVAGYAVVILTATVGMSAQVQRSTGAANQLAQSLEAINLAFNRSTGGAAVVPTNAADVDGSILIFTTTLPTSTGAAGTTTEQRAYCASPVASGKYRLAQFTIIGTYVGGQSSAACTSTGLVPLFGVGATVSVPTYLTDDTTSVLRFQVAPVQYGTGAPTPNPAGVWMLLTTLYDPTVSDPSYVDRASSGGKALPITSRTVSFRNFPYNRVPFSGF